MDNTGLFRDFAAILYRAGALTPDQFKNVIKQIDDLSDGAAGGVLAGVVASELESSDA